nr:NAD(P)/FAD-dependent oxidoreductase [Candidatus Njordarchaeota archaeon]
MNEDEYDVIVVGAGPAGSAASFSCASAGLKTLLVEALPLPRDKLCAGGVSAWVIKKLGIIDNLIERTIQQVQVVAGSRKIPVIPWPADMAYRMVMRKEFDHFLSEKAREAGAAVKDKTHVSTVLKDKNGIVRGVKTSHAEFKARLVIGCDGASSVVARTSGLWKKWWNQEHIMRGWRQHQAFCLEAQMQLNPQVIERRVGNTMTLLFEKTFPGYYWIFPKRKVLTVGLASFSSLTSSDELRDRLSKLIHNHPVASELLRDAKMGYLRGAYLPIRGPLSPSYDDGVMVAGDSAAHVGAVWGEGIYFAARGGIAAGETAVQAIGSNDTSKQFLKKYEDRWRKEIGENLEIQARILKEAPTPLQATITFTEYFIKNKSRLYSEDNVPTFRKTNY